MQRWIDRNRRMRGDYYEKPTAYWFVNCTPTNGLTIEKTKESDYKNVYPGKKGCRAGYAVRIEV